MDAFKINQHMKKNGEYDKCVCCFLKIGEGEKNNA